MWKTLVSFASLTIVLVAAAQPPETKKPADPPPGKSDQKPAVTSDEKPGKADQKPAGKGAAAAQFGPASESEKLLDQAIAKIEKLNQYRSDMRQVVEMFGYKFVADGHYAVGPDLKMLFELKIQLTDPGTTGTIKEVCDGKVHWKYQQIIDTPTLSRIDVQKIKKVLDDPKFDRDLRNNLIKQLGFSGIVPIMRGLRQSQKFASHDEGMLGGVPVYVLHGAWQESAINQSTARGVQLNVANLPPHIPDKSTVWIGQEDGWPYKIRMESTKKPQTGQTGPTVITLEFLDPMMDVELPESLFAFEPPTGLRPDDQTERLYQGLSSVLSPKAPIGLGPGPIESGQSKGKPALPGTSEKEKQ